MMKVEYSKIENEVELYQKMIMFDKFKLLQKKLKISAVMQLYKSIVIDIENTLITKLKINSQQELENITQLDNFKDNYITFYDEESKEVFKHQVYQLRPYIIQFLRAIQPIFELIVYSKLPQKTLLSIVTNLEEILNRPIKEYLDGQDSKDNESEGSFQRIK